MSSPQSSARPAQLSRLVWWGALLAVGWTLFPLLLFTDTLWREPSFMHTVLPGLYGSLEGLLPQEWREASVKIVPMRAITLGLYFMLVSGIWVAYIIAFRVAMRGGDRAPARPLRGILAGVAVFGALALFWPSLFSPDVYAYAAQGKMQVAQGLNPLVDAPVRMGNDPLVNLSPWKDIPSTYGPVWLAVTKAVAWVAEPLGGRPATYLLAFKVLNLGLIMLGTGLVWAIGGLLAWSAEHRRAACVLFGWCPLVLFDLVGSAHNDALLIVFILAAIWLHLRGWWAGAIAALMLGGLVKLSGFFLLPAYGVLLLRSSSNPREALRRTAIGLAVVAATLLTYLPYAHPGILKSFVSNPLAGSFGPSVGLSVRQVFVDIGMATRGVWTPPDITEQGIRDALQWPIWNSALIIWALLALAISLTARDFPTLVKAWALVLFTYLVIGSVWFMPWYITWLIPLLPLLQPGSWRRTIILFAWGGTLFYALTPAIPWDRTANLRNYYVPGIIFLPPLLYLAGVAIADRLKQRKVVATQQIAEPAANPTL